MISTKGKIKKKMENQKRLTCMVLKVISKYFKKVTLAAQLTYYKDKFDIRINTTKQLWINLN